MEHLRRSMSKECDFVYGRGVAVCRHCGRRVATRRPGLRAHCRPKPPPVVGGPGTELKALLKSFGILAKPNCACNKRAAAMDKNGCAWCEQHIEDIDRWLAEEAKKRKFPYFSMAGKMLIKLAIRRARKKGNKN